MYSNFNEILQMRAKLQPNDVAYTFLHGSNAEEITYSKLDQEAKIIAFNLLKNYKSGDRAILFIEPGLRFITTYFGCLYAGIIAIPAYPPRNNRNSKRIYSIMNDSKATVAITTEKVYSDIIRIISNGDNNISVKWLLIDNINTNIGKGIVPYSADSDTIAFLQYTSGSTGNPKGVMVSHGNLIHNSECIKERWGHDSLSIGVSWLPVFHDLGLIAGVLQPLYVGYPTFLFSPTDFVQNPFMWLDTISKNHATTSCAPNFAFDLCVRKIPLELRRTLDLSSWKTAMNGAENISYNTLKKFTDSFAPYGFRMDTFRGGYGLAEGTLFVTTGMKQSKPTIKAVSKAELKENRIVSTLKDEEDCKILVGCGPAGNDIEIIIVNPDTLKVCKTDEVGEIWIAGPSVTKGYWNRTSETEEIFKAYTNEKDGPYLKTGDLGFLKDGELFVTGRIKDIIIIRGKNYYPQDIEYTVANIDPTLRPGCTAAFSIEANDEEKVVVIQEISRHHKNVDLKKLMKNAYMAVAEEHELQLYSIVLIKEGSIPRTSSGKIQRRACLQEYTLESLNIVAQEVFISEINEEKHFDKDKLLEQFTLFDIDQKQKLVEDYLILTVSNLGLVVKEVDIHRSLIMLGLDSMTSIDLKNKIEDDLGVSISQVTFMGNSSISKLAKEVINKLEFNILNKESYSNRLNRSNIISELDELSNEEIDKMLNEMLLLKKGEE